MCNVYIIIIICRAIGRCDLCVQYTEAVYGTYIIIIQSVYAPCSFEKYTGTSDKKKIKYRPYGLIIIFKPAQPCILCWQQQQQLSIR